MLLWGPSRWRPPGHPGITHDAPRAPSHVTHCLPACLPVYTPRSVIINTQPQTVVIQPRSRAPRPMPPTA